MVLEKTLESPLNCKEIQPVHPKESVMNIHWKDDVEAEIPILCHLMWRTDSLENTLTLGKIEGRKRRGRQRLRCLDGFIDSMDTSLSKFQELVKNREARHDAAHGSQRFGHDWATELNWTESIQYRNLYSKITFLTVAYYWLNGLHYYFWKNHLDPMAQSNML